MIQNLDFFIFRKKFLNGPIRKVIRSKVKFEELWHLPKFLPMFGIPDFVIFARKIENFFFHFLTQNDSIREKSHKKLNFRTFDFFSVRVPLFSTKTSKSEIWGLSTHFFVLYGFIKGWISLTFPHFCLFCFLLSIRCQDLKLSPVRLARYYFSLDVERTLTNLNTNLRIQYGPERYCYHSSPDGWGVLVNIKGPKRGPTSQYWI